MTTDLRRRDVHARRAPTVLRGQRFRRHLRGTLGEVEGRADRLLLPERGGTPPGGKFHDLHHIATGYQTDWTGEAEIGGFEIGGGCGPFVWAWMLNLQAMFIGLLIAPRAAFRAFVRGRHRRSTLYHQGEFQDAMLDPLRRRDPPRSRPRPAVAARRQPGHVGLLLWSAISVVWTAWPFALLVWWLA